MSLIANIVFRSIDIGHLVTVRGLVTRSSDVKPCVAVCTYTCEMCGSELFQDVSDMYTNIFLLYKLMCAVRYWGVVLCHCKSAPPSDVKTIKLPVN